MQCSDLPTSDHLCKHRNGVGNGVRLQFDCNLCDRIRVHSRTGGKFISNLSKNLFKIREIQTIKALNVVEGNSNKTKNVGRRGSHDLSAPSRLLALAYAYILKVGFAGYKNPQMILNFPQKDCLRMRKVSR